MEIIKHQAPEEQSAIHKRSPKNRLLILAILGFLLIGLTITNIPIIYSESSSDMAGGREEEESSDDGGEEQEEESSDDEEQEESSDDGGEEQDKQEICDNSIGDNGDGNTDENDCKQQQQEDKQEVCDNNINDNGDGNIDNDGTDCKAEICDNDADDDGDGKIDEEDSDCKAEICDNDADDDDDGKTDGEDSDCKAELRATGKFIVKVKNDDKRTNQPQDFKLRIEVSEGTASPSNFDGAGPPGTTVEFSGGGEFSVVTKHPNYYTESVSSDCPSGKIPQAFTCTFSYDDKVVRCKAKPGIACAIVDGVASGGTVIGSISATGPAKLIRNTPSDPDTGESTTPDPDKGETTTPGFETSPSKQKPLLTLQPFTSYKSDEKALSVNYPHDWQITENTNNVTFKSPPESSSDRFEEALRVLKVPYKDPLSALTDKIVGEARTNLPSFQIINSSDTVLGGIPANSLVYTYTDNRVGMLQEMVVLTIKDDSAYIIGYIAELPKYSYYLPVIQEMINSIELSDNKAETSSLLPFIPQLLPSS